MYDIANEEEARDMAREDALKMRKIQMVLAEVAQERVRQESKWGEQNHHAFPYLAILGEEVGEANQAAVKATFEDGKWSDYRKELIQVAAVAVAMVEAYDRNKDFYIDQ